jgi:hypothetical protein
MIDLPSPVRILAAL